MPCSRKEDVVLVVKRVETDTVRYQKGGISVRKWDLDEVSCKELGCKGSQCRALRIMS